jgi:hypothetical protein
VQLLEEEQEINIFNKCKNEIKILKVSAEDGEFWMGKVEGDEFEFEPLVASRQFIKRLEMLTELCLYNPDRIVDNNDQAKKG